MQNNEKMIEFILEMSLMEYDVGILGDYYSDNSWLSREEPNNLKHAMQVMMDRQKQFKGKILYVEGTLYFSAKKNKLCKKSSLWQPDSEDYNTFRKWFNKHYGIILSDSEIKELVNLCVKHKIIRKKSKDKFEGKRLMYVLVESK